MELKMSRNSRFSAYDIVINPKIMILVCIWALFASLVEFFLYYEYNDEWNFAVLIGAPALFFILIFIYARFMNWQFGKLFREPPPGYEEAQREKKRVLKAEYYDFLDSGSVYHLFRVVDGKSAFYEFKSRFFNNVRSRYVTYPPLLIIVLVFLINIPRLLTGEAIHSGVALGVDLNENMAVLIWELCIYLPTFAFSYTFIAWVVFSLAAAFKTLNEFSSHEIYEKLTIYDIEEIVDENPGLWEIQAGDMFESYARYSLKHFREATRGVAQLSIYVAILGSLGVLLAVFWSWSWAQGAFEEGDTLLLTGLLFLDILFIGILIFLFLYPQTALHKVIIQAQRRIIRKLEGLHQKKLAAYFSMIREKRAPEEIGLLVQEVEFIAKQIEKVESVITWPFNYNQLGAFIISMAIAIGSVLLPYVLSFLEI
jgi:hypothetical protein